MTGAALWLLCGVLVLAVPEAGEADSPLVGTLEHGAAWVRAWWPC